MIKADIIKDSVSVNGSRVTTFVLTYPRFIHSEFMTHRMISKNASSSRAIPTAKMIEAIENNPAMPIAFSENCKGMQAKNDLDDNAQEIARYHWLKARDAALLEARNLSALGVHKQHVNRLLEPFQHITVVATATDWSNFFALRCHPDAQPEFHALAKLMWEQYSTNDPRELIIGEWHLPFVTGEEEHDLKTLMFLAHKGEYIDQCKILIKRSVARCARVSYNTHDGTDNTLEKDLELYNRLVGGEPIHASPTEHQAAVIADRNHQSGNFKGWLQYRKTLSNENILKYPNSAKS